MFYIKKSGGKKLKQNYLYETTHTHTLTYIELRTRKKQNKTLDSAPINHCKRNS